MLFAIVIIPICVVCYVCSKVFNVFQTNPSIEGKHVVIIGGSSGIGKSIATHCAFLGAHVTIIARNVSRLKDTLTHMETCRSNKEQIFKSLSVHCDDYENAKINLRRVDEALPIDMLICCAGKAICGTFTDLSVDNITEMININLLATMYPIKAVLHKMKERKQGRIVITGSQGGLVGLYGLSVYAATKFALRGLAEALHMELNDFNISVTLALPPDTDTPGFETENKTKPLITKKLSEAGGLESPDKVAKQIINDALQQHFLSYIGLGSFVLTNLAIGMAPFQSLYQLFFQALILGPLRLIGGICLYSFRRKISQTIKEESLDKNK